LYGIEYEEKMYYGRASEFFEDGLLISTNLLPEAIFYRFWHYTDE